MGPNLLKSKILRIELFKSCYKSIIKFAKPDKTEIHRVLWKIKKIVYFCGSNQPVSLITLVVTVGEPRKKQRRTNQRSQVNTYCLCMCFLQLINQTKIITSKIPCTCTNEHS